MCQDNPVAQGVTLKGGGDNVELSRGKRWKGPLAFMSNSRVKSFVGAMKAIIDIFGEIFFWSVRLVFFS